jgi:predicted RND superfamily exporter protein
MTGWLEHFLFRWRAVVLAVLALFTAAMAWQASQVKIDAGFLKQLPTNHPYVKTFLDYQAKLPGTNSVTVIVESKRPTIWTQKYLRRLYDVTEAVKYLPGVFKGSVSSLWTPDVQILAVTEDGVSTHNLIPSDFTRVDMPDESIHKMRAEAEQSYYRGRLYAFDRKSSVVNFDLQDVDPETGKPLNYLAVAQQIDRDIREKYTDSLSAIRILGFAPLIAEIANAARNVAVFFAVSFALTTLAIFAYSRALGLTLVAVGSASVALVWQFGVLSTLGMGLDPMAMLVPFLVFAIGASHGIQQISVMTSEIAHGRSAEEAARITFSRLLAPGTMALLTALIGFLALLTVPIPLIREMAVIASIGVGLTIVSSLVMLPLLASYLSAPRDYARRMLPVWARRQARVVHLAALASPGRAPIVLLVAALAFVGATFAAQNRIVGDVRAGVAELRDSAKYNADQRFYAERYDANLDNFVVVAETDKDSCVRYEDMKRVERFGHAMAQVEGVRRVISLPEVAKLARVFYSEGNLKWHELPRSREVLSLIVTPFGPSTGLLDNQSTFLTVAIYLEDHKAATLDRVAAAIAQWTAANPTPGINFRAATGNGGVLKAINDAVRESEGPMLATVYIVVMLLVLVVYRDWRAVFCCCTPLFLGTALGYAVMNWLGIGLKVSTLPVLALATVTGVDYTFYIYSRLLHYQKAGRPVAEAYAAALRDNGLAVIFTGLTLALGVFAWIFSSLKFQADMGLLLAFMFLVNMIGAVTLLPAIAATLDRVAPRGMSLPARPEPA